MANTYSWTDHKMIVDPSYMGLDNVIRKVLATYTAEDESGNKASQLMNIKLNEPDPGNFIPYEDLTLVEVLAWLEELVDTGFWQLQLDDRLYEATQLSLMACPWD